MTLVRPSPLAALVAIALLFQTLIGMDDAQAGPRQDTRLATAAQVLDELRQTPDQNVPGWLLDRAYAVAVVPRVIKVGLTIGGRYGKGAMAVRRDDGSWSNPVFINLAGGSFGFQIGVQSTDIVLVFMSRASIEGIVGGKVTLGADASVAAGPVGRQTSAATDIGFTAQVYSYSRASGLFAGVALDGSALTIDHSSNEDFYGRQGIMASEIIAPGATQAPEPGQKFLAALMRSTPVAQASPAPPPAGSVTNPPVGQSTTTPVRPAGNGSLTTFPLEDKNPGAEPPG
ncbi:MAG: lipid-binding SYLF domain-containing protein [Steroidobacteraceae bacterium]